MALTREQVVEAAIELLEDVGLDGLTLRRLASELGVSAPTLYWHVRDKRELLDLMAEAMMRSYRSALPPIPDDYSWDERIAEGARRQYQALLHHRDGARVAAGNRPTDTSLPMIEDYLKLWVDAGFPPDEALATILSLGDFIAGAALEFQAETERRREKTTDEPGQFWAKMDEYPTLRAAATELRRRTQHSGFEHGLGMFLDAVRFRREKLLAQDKQARRVVRSTRARKMLRATPRPSADRPR